MWQSAGGYVTISRRLCVNQQEIMCNQQEVIWISRRLCDSILYTVYWTSCFPLLNSGKFRYLVSKLDSIWEKSRFLVSKIVSIWKKSRFINSFCSNFRFPLSNTGTASYLKLTMKLLLMTPNIPCFYTKILSKVLARSMLSSLFLSLMTDPIEQRLTVVIVTRQHPGVSPVVVECDWRDRAVCNEL